MCKKITNVCFLFSLHPPSGAQGHARKHEKWSLEMWKRQIIRKKRIVITSVLGQYTNEACAYHS